MNLSIDSLANSRIVGQSRLEYTYWGWASARTHHDYQLLATGRGENAVSTELTYPHIAKQEGQPARLRRTPRVRVAQIAMDYLTHGWSAEEMCRQHPYLAPAEAHAAMAYYFDHQAEIDSEIEAERETVKESRAEACPTPFELRVRAEGSS